MILTRDELIPHLQNLTVAPITTRVRGIDSQVVLETFDGLTERSAISLDNIQTVPKDSLGALITDLTRVQLRQLQQAVVFALGLDAFEL